MKSKKIPRQGEGENYDYSQDHCFIKLSSRDTNGELCLIEDTLKPCFHLERHHHKIMTEDDFSDKELMKSFSAKFDIYEA